MNINLLAIVTPLSIYQVYFYGKQLKTFSKYS